LKELCRCLACAPTVGSTHDVDRKLGVQHVPAQQSRGAPKTTVGRPPRVILPTRATTAPRQRVCSRRRKRWPE
jgi:hypothetical protein